MSLPDILSNPIAYIALVVIVATAMHYQRGLTWSEYRMLHTAKTIAFPILHRYRPYFVSPKGYRDESDEYIGTVAMSVKTAARAAQAVGHDLHLISSIKRRTADDSAQYSAAHLVYTHTDGYQTEIYLFDNGDGSVDVYAHHEPTTTNPEDHLDTDKQTGGDPAGVVPDKLRGSSEVIAL